MVDRCDSPVPNVRNVVIVGTTGTEKIISEQLEGSKKGEVVCKTTVFESFESTYNQDAPKHLDDLKEIHLVLFVIHSGRITKETIDNICKVHPCVSKISALLLAGCEGKNEAAREKIEKEFRDASFTKDIVNFMQQGIYAVGFPNISEVRPSFKEIYTEDMMQDAECLLKIVKDQNSPVDLGETFFKSGRQSTQGMIGLQQDTMGERAALPGERAALPGERRALPEERRALPGERMPLPEECMPLLGERTPLPGERTPLPGERSPLQGKCRALRECMERLGKYTLSLVAKLQRCCKMDSC